MNTALVHGGFQGTGGQAAASVRGQKFVMIKPRLGCWVFSAGLSDVGDGWTTPDSGCFKRYGAAEADRPGGTAQEEARRLRTIRHGLRFRFSLIAPDVLSYCSPSPARPGRLLLTLLLTLPRCVPALSARTGFGLTRSAPSASARALMVERPILMSFAQ